MSGRSNVTKEFRSHFIKYELVTLLLLIKLTLLLLELIMIIKFLVLDSFFMRMGTHQHEQTMEHMSGLVLFMNKCEIYFDVFEHAIIMSWYSFSAYLI